ncbi:MAG: SDR family NAD(P)-dependent oxidoreductase [Succinatimonas sp.]|nr:SDR family NAD(P)-dependent oxidoreductase [Succinatimonas sp.]
MKKVLITGGNGDIAQAIKFELESEGYTVYAPPKAELDVTDEKSIENAISKFIPDVLINNAGYVVPQSIRESNLSNTKKHIDINLLGTFFCSEISLKYNPKVDIVNITSAAAVEKHATWSEYCATKAAVVMATKCWADDGLYAVAISPGRTKTKMRKSLYPNEDQNTLLDPKDFAKVISKAVHREYSSGVHILVRKQTVNDILRGKIDELF